jgi:hypothetical protein
VVAEFGVVAVVLAAVVVLWWACAGRRESWRARRPRGAGGTGLASIGPPALRRDASACSQAPLNNGRFFIVVPLEHGQTTRW